MFTRLWALFRELQWIAVAAFVLCLVVFLGSIYLAIKGEYFSAIVGFGFSGLILSKLSSD